MSTHVGHSTVEGGEKTAEEADLGVSNYLKGWPLRVMIMA